MTLVTEKVSPLTTSLLSRCVLLVTILLLAVAGQARSADTQVWAGQYKSSTLKDTVYVWLKLNENPPKLEFKPASLGACSVGLKLLPKSSKSSGSDLYGITQYNEEKSGPCSIWVDGTLEIEHIDDSLKLHLRKRDSRVDVTLTPEMPRLSR